MFKFDKVSVSRLLGPTSFRYRVFGPFCITVLYSYLIYNLLLYSPDLKVYAKLLTNIFIIAISISYLILFQGKDSWRAKILTKMFQFMEWFNYGKGRIIAIFILIAVISGSFLFGDVAFGNLKSNFERYGLIFPFVGGVFSSLFINTSIFHRIWKGVSINRVILLMLFLFWSILVFYLSIYTDLKSALLWLVISLSFGILIGNMAIRIIFSEYMVHKVETDTGVSWKDGKKLHKSYIIKSKAGKLKKLISDGKNFRAIVYLFANLSLIFNKKERTVGFSRLCYSRGYNCTTLNLIDKYNYSNPKDISERLRSIRALALRRKGLHEDALKHLANSGKFYKSPYLLINAGIISHDLGEFKAALNFTKKASKRAPKCDVVWTNMAYIKMERFLRDSNCTNQESEFKIAVNESFGLLRRGHSLKKQGSKMSSNVLDTFGYFYMLSGSDSDIKKAIKILGNTMFVNIAARYHFALLKMVNTKNYLYAEILLHSVLRNAQRSGQKLLHDLAKNNLEKIKYAIKEKAVLSQQSIKYHFSDYGHLPDFVKEPQIIRSSCDSNAESIESENFNKVFENVIRCNAIGIKSSLVTISNELSKEELKLYQSLSL